jgi:hypothetical protein
LQPGDWAFLAGGKPLPKWMPWTPLWRVVLEILDALGQAGASPRNPAILSSRLRDTFATQGQELAAAGLLPLFDLRSSAPGSELIATLAERLHGALGAL